MHITTFKHTCDRCGNSLENSGILAYPKDWQELTLAQTGAVLDLCDECNNELLTFLSEKGGENMKLATHKVEMVL